MDLDDLYDKLGELLDKANTMCGGDFDVNDPYDAIDALTDLIDEKGASKKITSLIDEIAEIMEYIDEIEAEEFYDDEDDDEYDDEDDDDDDDMMFESKKKVIKITESDLMRISKKVLIEQEVNYKDSNKRGTFYRNLRKWVIPDLPKDEDGIIDSLKEYGLFDDILNFDLLDVVIKDVLEERF